MKTTLDLPDDLVKTIKVRAAMQGTKLKDTVADLLRQGLAAESQQNGDQERAIISTDSITGLPIVVCRHPAAAGMELTPDRVADTLLDQEVTWHEQASRH